MSSTNSSLAVLLGGKDISISKRDGSAETVKVLLVEIEAYPKLLAAMENEQTQIAIYCERPVEWAKSLTPASHSLVMETAEELNRDFFTSWVRRRLDKLEMIKPGLLANLSDGLANKGSALPNGSPRLPGNAALHSHRPGNFQPPS